MSNADQTRPDLEALAATAHVVLSGTTGKEIAAAGRARVSAAIARRPPRLRLPAFAVAAAAAALGLWWHAGRPAPLGYTVSGAETSRAGHIRARSDQPAKLNFSDGTDVTLHAGARGRIATVDDRGAGLQLETGTARLSVRKRPDARWWVQAGAFEVRVRGTTFAVSWDPTHERLQVNMFEGTVAVYGPSSPSGTPVHAGQRLTASARTGHIEIHPVAPVEARDGINSGVAAHPTVEEPDLAEASRPAQATPRPRHGGTTHVPSWSARVAQGHFADVISQAHAMGINRCLKACPIAHLTALADAARYSDDSGLAARALAFLHRRFPDSEQGRGAAFLIGRLKEQTGRSREALRWYDRYLEIDERGPLAAEAAGRRLLIVQQSDPPRARALAAVYLERHAGGPYAHIARQILVHEEPSRP